MDRRHFLKGSAGLAAIGAIARLDAAIASAATLHDPLPGSIGPPPPAAWPPAPGAFRGLVARWIVRENERVGTSEWSIGGAEPAGAVAARRDGPVAPGIRGYLDTTSAAIGQRIAFHISSASPTYRITAYRMGWNQGRGGRTTSSTTTTRSTTT